MAYPTEQLTIACHQVLTGLQVKHANHDLLLLMEPTIGGGGVGRVTMFLLSDALTLLLPRPPNATLRRSLGG